MDPGDFPSRAGPGFPARTAPDPPSRKEAIRCLTSSALARSRSAVARIVLAALRSRSAVTHRGPSPQVPDAGPVDQYVLVVTVGGDSKPGDREEACREPAQCLTIRPFAP